MNINEKSSSDDINFDSILNDLTNLSKEFEKEKLEQSKNIPPKVNNRTVKKSDNDDSEYEFDIGDTVKIRDYLSNPKMKNKIFKVTDRKGKDANKLYKLTNIDDGEIVHYFEDAIILNAKNKESFKYELYDEVMHNDERHSIVSRYVQTGTGINIYILKNINTKEIDSVPEDDLERPSVKYKFKIGDIVVIDDFKDKSVKCEVVERQYDPKYKKPIYKVKSLDTDFQFVSNRVESDLEFAEVTNAVMNKCSKCNLIRKNVKDRSVKDSDGKLKFKIYDVCDECYNKYTKSMRDDKKKQSFKFDVGDTVYYKTFRPGFIITKRTVNDDKNMYYIQNEQNMIFVEESTLQLIKKLHDTDYTVGDPVKVSENSELYELYKGQKFEVASIYNEFVYVWNKKSGEKFYLRMKDLTKI